MADSSKIKMSTDLPIDSSSSSSNSPSTHHPSQNDKLNDEIVKKLQNQSLFGDSEVKPEQVEDEHVHKVYDEIANHFSSTRYKGWPRIVNWLGNRGDNVLGIDIGCGNGKYLFYTRNTYAGLQKIHEESNESKLNAKVPSLSNSFMVGCDRSVGLVSICGERKLPVFVANGLDIPCRGGIFDYAISIAVIHHMSTRARRIEAIKEMIRVLSPKGQGLIYVWALEQEVFYIFFILFHLIQIIYLLSFLIQFFFRGKNLKFKITLFLGIFNQNFRKKKKKKKQLFIKDFITYL